MRKREFGDYMVVEGLSPNLHMKALTELWDLLPAGVELNLIPYEDAFESLKEKAINEGEVSYTKTKVRTKIRTQKSPSEFLS